MAIKISKNLNVPQENYIIFHHTNTKIIIPVDPDNLADSMSASFSSSSPLSRSAPIYSYSNSGPRSVQLTFTLHRDLCKEYNSGLSGDPVEDLITNLDQMVLPDYNSVGKIVNPPVVSVRIRDEIYIKGIVTSCSHSYNLPIINYGTETSPKMKYALVNLNFGVQEIKPYSASIIANIGQYRSN